ncbi:MAG: hypothetical protein ACOC1K_04930 [Nanoarchaeota archaeon]
MKKKNINSENSKLKNYDISSQEIKKKKLYPQEINKGFLSEKPVGFIIFGGTGDLAKKNWHLQYIIFLKVKEFILILILLELEEDN